MNSAPLTLAPDDPLAVRVVETIRSGDVQSLHVLLAKHPGLVQARIGDPNTGNGSSRTLLHVVTDWPGKYPNGPEIVRLLVSAGADVNARFTGPHTETPLHWAASSDDVPVLDTLLDAGADLEAAGAVIGGGTPLSDAVAFGQWKAARRLVHRGAKTTLPEAAALGLMDRVQRRFREGTPPGAEEVHAAFWYACHGGQLTTAKYLLSHGADPNWLPAWERLTPLDAARRSKAADVTAWLVSEGAKSAKDLPQ